LVHLPAIAGRVGLKVPLDKVDAFSRTTPLLVNVRPSGQWHMEDLFEAGGVPAVLKELAPLLHLDCLTVNGRTLGENLEAARVDRRDVIRPLSDPLAPEGGTAGGTVVLHGCPEAAVGGPLALVRDGDIIELDVAGRTLNVHLADDEVRRRRAAWDPSVPVAPRGYGKLFLDHVLQADEGCD